MCKNLACTKGSIISQWERKKSLTSNTTIVYKPFWSKIKSDFYQTRYTKINCKYVVNTTNKINVFRFIYLSLKRFRQRFAFFCYRSDAFLM